MLDEDFIASLPDDPYESLLEICEQYEIFDSEHEDERDNLHYDKYLEAYGILQAFVESHKIGSKFESLGSNKWNNVNKIGSYFKKHQELAKDEIVKRNSARIVEQTKNMFSVKIGKAFAYEFSDEDIERIQLLINELRDLIQASAIEKGHKSRLLKRLEKLQGELHKKVSDLDRFWGLVGDASIVLKKVGENSKPLVDRVREIMEIVWKTQTSAEGLPKGTSLPLLKNEGDDNS